MFLLFLFVLNAFLNQLLVISMSSFCVFNENFLNFIPGPVILFFYHQDFYYLSTECSFKSAPCVRDVIFHSQWSEVFFLPMT